MRFFSLAKIVQGEEDTSKGKILQEIESNSNVDGGYRNKKKLFKTQWNKIKRRNSFQTEEQKIQMNEQTKKKQNTN